MAQTNTGLTFSGQDISCISTVWSPDGTNGKQLTATGYTASPLSYYFPSNTSPAANFTQLLEGQLLTINNQSGSTATIYVWGGGPQILFNGNYYATTNATPSDVDPNFTIGNLTGYTFVLTGGTYWVQIAAFST